MAEARKAIHKMPKPKSTSQIRKERTSREPRGFFKKCFRALFWTGVILFITSCAAVVGVYFYLSEDLPKISSLADYRPPVVTTVFSDDNRKIAEFYKERRIVKPLSQMPVSDVAV